MTIKNTNASRQLIRSFAAGLLLSMIAVYLFHYFGTWEAGIDRPDAETTGSVVLYNKCAVLNDTHLLRPSTSSSANVGTRELKFAGSFMNFFDGHIVLMITIAFVFTLILFAIKKTGRSVRSSSNGDS